MEKFYSKEVKLDTLCNIFLQDINDSVLDKTIQILQKEKKKGSNGSHSAP